MRAASTGGGLIRLVVIWLVVLAALMVIMTAAGASSTSAAAAAAAAAATATVSATTTTVPATVTAAAHRVAASPTSAALAATGVGFNATTVAATDEAATVTATATAGTGYAGEDAACAPVRVSLRKPACTGQISEGPGPPSSRCPAARPCGTGRTDNNDNVNVNKYNNDKSKRNNNDNDNDNNYNNNTSNHQCLEYARRDRVPEMCPDDPGAYRRPGRLSRYRLRHCCHHTVESVVQRPYTDWKSCSDQVNQALDMDDIAAAMSCQFNEVLARYDCQQNYSARSCDSCKVSQTVKFVRMYLLSTIILYL